MRVLSDVVVGLFTGTALGVIASAPILFTMWMAWHG